MVEGYYQLADLVDEQKIVTLDGKSSIRFNEFYNPHKVSDEPSAVLGSHVSKLFIKI